MSTGRHGIRMEDALKYLFPLVEEEREEKATILDRQGCWRGMREINVFIGKGMGMLGGGTFEFGLEHGI